MKKIYFLFLILPLIYSCKKEEPKDNENNIVVEETTKTSPYNQNIKEEEKETYFSLPSNEGKIITIKDYSNNPVLIIFFSEHCPYCKKAIPFMNEIYKEYSSKGLKVIGISFMKNKESLNEYKKTYNINYPVVYEGHKIAKNYQVQGVPFIYLLDKRHNHFNMWMGYDKSYDKDIKSSIQKVL